MEEPGMSLFQGAGSIHINNSVQDRLEEEEEAADQKRRAEELKQTFANAFNDLQEDDEDESLNSSGNHTHDTPQTNGDRAGLPTYIESLNHITGHQNCNESPKYTETPKNHLQHMLRNQEDVISVGYSPYGAGDGLNHNFHQDFQGNLNDDGRLKHGRIKELQGLYELRTNEINKYADDIVKLEQQIDSLRGRLSAALSDKEKAELSLQQSHHLLANCKHIEIEQEQKLTKISEKLLMAEQENEQLKLELSAADVNLQEVQRRLHTLQVSQSHDRDALFREQQDRHREEVDRLQSDLLKAKDRLKEKENEIMTLEYRCKERVKEKEDILIEKGATINRLAEQLEAAQRLRNDRGASRDQLKVMGRKLEETAHELVLCRRKLADTQTEFDNWRSSFNQILWEFSSNNTFNIGVPLSPGKLATLKEILSRYKAELQKVPELQEELVKRDKRIEHHRKQESELRSKLEEYRGMEMQLNSRIAVLQNKLDLLSVSPDVQLLDGYKHQNEQLRKDLEDIRAELKNEELKYAELEMDYEKLKKQNGSRTTLVEEANADLKRQLQQCSAQLQESRRECGELKTLYLKVCSERDSAKRETEDVRNKVQKEKEMFRTQEAELVERMEKEKRQVEKLTTELTSSKEDLERANKRISELQTEFTDKQREFTDKLNKFLEDEKSAMRKEITACVQCEKQLRHIRNLEEQLSQCSVKLAAQESNETLMKELKGKAEFFQKYILERYQRLVDQRSVATSTDGDAREQAQVEQLDAQDADAELDAKNTLMMKEKVIRDQIAEKFTLEMKTIEMNCARRLKEMETEQLTAVSKLKSLLERKAKEVETLKEFILSERSKVTKILELKENEISVLIKEHNELQEECQKTKDDCVDLRHKVEKYKEKLAHLGSLEDLLKKEKVDWKRVVKLEADHQTLVEKYKNAKRAVLTYKDYMAKKDNHINNEMNRIQNEYRKIVVKLQDQINYYVTLREQEERRLKASEGPQYPENNYTEKLNELTQDLARLAQLNLKDNLDNKK